MPWDTDPSFGNPFGALLKCEIHLKRMLEGTADRHPDALNYLLREVQNALDYLREHPVRELMTEPDNGRD
jgi:hypothetical protein